MAEDQQPLDLRADAAIDLGYATDFHILLRAIDEAMPDDAVLALDGHATAPAISAWLHAREPAETPAMAPNSHGKTEVFHLPLADGNLAALRLLAEDYPAPEIAFHLAVYRDRDVLLWAHDAGEGAVLLSRSLPEETIERFRTALGDSLRLPKRHGFLGLFRRRDH
jgi:DNA-binding NarL/FixJ family response regulator